jgi:hypothetical protein
MIINKGIDYLVVAWELIFWLFILCLAAIFAILCCLIALVIMPLKPAISLYKKGKEFIG